MSGENKAVVRRIINEHWNKKKPALAAELFTTKVAIHTPDGELHGHEGEMQLYNAYAAAFPDFNVSADDIIAEGNKVVVRYTFTGTQKGPLAAIPASGKKVSVQGIVIFRIAKGHVDELHFLWDKFALMQQIGALPISSKATG